MSTSAFSLATNEYGNQNKDLLLLQCRKSLGKSELIRIRPVANTILGFDANGDPATYTASDLIIVEGALPLAGGTMTGPIILAVGAANAPSLGFAGNATTGLFWGGSGTINLSSNGTQTFRFASSSGNAIVYGGTVLNSLSLLTSGAIALVAAGTNQSITLTPSGTGDVTLGANSNYFAGKKSDATQGRILGVSSGNVIQIGDIQNNIGGSVDLYVAGGIAARFAVTNGHLLLGGLTTDGTGILQFPVSTTTAGGISWSTTNLYPNGAGSIVINATSGANPAITLADNGTGKSSFQYLSGNTLIDSGTGSLILKSATVTALTIDASQNATFAGVTIQSTDTLSGAGAVSVTKGTTKFTSTGGAQALTLANGTDGQIKRIIHVVDGGSGVLTPTTKTGFSTITFTNPGDAVTLQYVTTQGWCIVGVFGAVAA